MPPVAFTPNAARRVADATREVEDARSEAGKGLSPRPSRRPGQRAVRVVSAGASAGLYVARESTLDRATGVWSDHPAGMTFGVISGDQGELMDAGMLPGIPPDTYAYIDSIGTPDGRRRWVMFAGPSTPLLGKLTASAGAAGDEDNDCTFTYTLADLAGNQLATGLTPKRPRFPKTTYTAAPVDSYATYAHDGTAFVLLDAIEEWPQSHDCEEE